MLQLFGWLSVVRGRMKSHGICNVGLNQCCGSSTRGLHSTRGFKIRKLFWLGKRKIKSDTKLLTMCTDFTARKRRQQSSHNYLHIQSKPSCSAFLRYIKRAKPCYKSGFLILQEVFRKELCWRTGRVSSSQSNSVFLVLSTGIPHKQGSRINACDNFHKKLMHWNVSSLHDLARICQICEYMLTIVHVCIEGV